MLPINNKSCFFLLTLSSFIFTSFLFSDEQATEDLTFPADAPAPWFTGPLIAPSGYTVKPGHVNIQPYVYFSANQGGYDDHWKYHSSSSNFYTARMQLQLKFGLVKGLDLQINPQGYYNSTEGKNYVNIGDLRTTLNIQALGSQLKDPWPAIKLGLRANIPIGKYEHLNPHLKGTDAIGTGSWLPSAIVTLAKLWHTYSIHYLEARLSFTYQLGTPAYVKGYNSYGGASNTKGKAYLGNQLIVDGALQYNLSQRWTLACDFYYHHNNKNRFSGKRGSYPDGSPAIVTKPSYEQFSLAPAIEYNWNKNLGLIGGVWFTLAGRNAAEFATGILSMNIYL